ncbi:hypothetical protein [Pseudoalteromonas phage PH357]|nr:hypothetical protein [Pseudoalteromonas phage PH357]
MSKIVTVPLLASVSVEIEDESLSKEEMIDLAIRAANYSTIKVDNKSVQEDLGEEIYVDDFIEYSAYEKICQGNFFLGHISDTTIEDGWD